MAADSKIEWTDHTFNPWIGCTKVSPACDHCYAERSTPSRTLGVTWGAGQSRRRTSMSSWALPQRWNEDPYFECPDCGLRGNARAMGDEPKACKHLNAKPTRARVFCASLADVFDNEVPTAWRMDLFELIADTPNLDWLILTKRIGNVERMCAGDSLMFDVIANRVWLGATICNQAEADRDIAKLLRVPARLRFLSMEPLLGPVDLTDIPISGHGHHEFEPIITGNVLMHKSTLDLGAARPAIDWVIVGGESGPEARPMHPDWARSLRDQCQAAGVPFLFKQWGEWGPDWEGAETCSNCGQTKFDAINARGECGNCGNETWQPADRPLDGPCKVGKKAAGRLLDGRNWNEAPA